MKKTDIKRRREVAVKFNGLKSWCHISCSSYNCPLSDEIAVLTGRYKEDDNILAEIFFEEFPTHIRWCPVSNLKLTGRISDKSEIYRITIYGDKSVAEFVIKNLNTGLAADEIYRKNEKLRKLFGLNKPKSTKINKKPRDVILE